MFGVEAEELTAVRGSVAWTVVRKGTTLSVLFSRQRSVFGVEDIELVCVFDSCRVSPLCLERECFCLQDFKSSTNIRKHSSGKICPNAY